MTKRTLFALILVVYSLPATLLAARLELRQAGTGATQASVLVGGEIDIEVWVDSESEELSGAAIFLSFDETRFALVDNDRAEVAGFQPFAPGDFLGNGEIYRNYLLSEDDPAAGAPGIQLDFSVVRAEGRGEGPIASFRLRTLAPVRADAIRIDENGVRETRVFLPDGSQRAFRFVTPLNLTVQGISIGGLPEQLILSRGDTRTLNLDELVFDPLYAPSDLTWTLSETPALSPVRDGSDLHLLAPADASPWERLELTVINPDGQTARASVDIFVNAAPTLADLGPLVFLEDESYEIPLDALVEDPDTAPDFLSWSASSSPEIAVEITGPPFTARLTAQPQWHGQGQIELIVADNHAFADTLQIAVSVEAVNDAPRLLSAPNVRLTRGKSDDSLVLADLVADIEDPTAALGLSWSGNDRVDIELRDGRLVLASSADWEGTEEILLVVEDSGGLTATGLLTVTVVPSLPPALIDPPQRLGLAAGEHRLLSLEDTAVDPDDASDALSWDISGHHRLGVQLSGGRLVRIEAPADFVGIETLTFAVADPSGGSATFELIVFAASSAGDPLLADLPGIRMPLAGVDTSIDLDDYVFDIDHPNADLAFFLPERGDIGLRVDPLTHVLIVEPGASAQAGSYELEVRVTDPEGREAVQMLHLELFDAAGEPVDSGPVEPAFSFNPIPDFTLVTDQVHSFGLDSFIAGDFAPDTVVWQVSGQQNLLVFIDPANRQASVRASDGWTGSEQITFSAQVADLPAQSHTVRITIIADPDQPVAPALAELPTLQLEAGAFDQSLDLNAFLQHAEVADFTWELSGGEHVSALIDAETHRLFVFTEDGFSGEETLMLVGTMTDGTRLEAVLRVDVHATALDLALAPRTEVPLFAGAASLRLPFDQLVTGDIDPALLTWAARGLQPVVAAYDPATHSVVLKPESPWQTSDIIELIASNPQGNQFSGLVLAQVYPTDGSVGAESADFQLVLLPNPLQPAYAHIYVISQLDAQDPPLLRFSDGAWNNLALSEHSAGIWQGHHLFAPGAQYEFLALSIDGANQLFKSGLLWRLDPPGGNEVAAKPVIGYGWPADK